MKNLYMARLFLCSLMAVVMVVSFFAVISCVAPFVSQSAQVAVKETPDWFLALQQVSAHKAATDMVTAENKAPMMWYRVCYFTHEGKVETVRWYPEHEELKIPIVAGMDTPVVAYPLNSLKPYGGIIPRGSYGRVTVELSPEEGWLAEVVLSRPYLFDYLCGKAIVSTEGSGSATTEGVATVVSLQELQKEVMGLDNPWMLEAEPVVQRMVEFHNRSLSHEAGDLFEVTLHRLPAGAWISDCNLINTNGVAMISREGVPTELPELPVGVWRFLHKEHGFVVTVYIDPTGKVMATQEGF